MAYSTTPIPSVKEGSHMEAHQDDDIMIMEDMKSHIKGKRTKRRRPASSALTLSIACTTSSSSTTTTSTTTGAPANPTFFHMPITTSIDFTNILHDNDEDVANCLILLAHGHNLPAAPSPVNAVVSPPLYVYECKTCNRSFTSFQALGGHRASHNKPHKDVHCQPSKNRTSLSISPNKNVICSPSGLIKGPKVHECSICGSDFTSGQALGGHMRRHRSMSMATTTCSTSNGCHESKKHKTLLSLDLNLPAPVEDDHKETKFGFSSNNQIIVFSAPSLVDCHF
ncbi:unnamed protein product [Lactuca saligna]|uniref:C2H2-type domain-containing protein n=1 Tax=Lactuca saligna TaxID=75948 RepID=A0AA36EAV2_LACSI|nr:unnamed protein product [Lactuca saligna]